MEYRRHGYYFSVLYETMCGSTTVPVGVSKMFTITVQVARADLL